MDLTCTVAHATPLLLNCRDSAQPAGLTQAWATLITGFFAVAAAFIALWAASRQARAAETGARAQAAGTVEAQERAAKLTTEREAHSKELVHAAIRRQIGANAYNTIGAGAHIMISNPAPTNHEEYERVVQRLVDRLLALDSAEALDSPTFSKALTEIAYLESALTRLRRRWVSGDTGPQFHPSLKAGGWRIFEAAEAVAKSVDATDAIRYASELRELHLQEFRTIERRAASSRTLIRPLDAD